MDTAEELAHLYFRLNGFFTVANYILQNPDEWTDIDVLGVRFPQQEEVLGGERLCNDPGLELGPDRIEVVLAEVGRTKDDFNRSWRDAGRMRYVLSFVGIFDDPASLDRASRVLARLRPFEAPGLRVRPMLCTACGSVQPGLTYVHLQRMLDFIQCRFRKHKRYKRYMPQWAGTLAQRIFKLASGSRRVTLDDIDRPA